MSDQDRSVTVLHPDPLEGVGVGDALLVLADVGSVIHSSEAVWADQVLVRVTGGWTLAMEGSGALRNKNNKMMTQKDTSGSHFRL